MPCYTLDKLDDLEIAAEKANKINQKAALIIITGLLEQHNITYGIIGGMNFYLRGSGRTTEDIDIAVDNMPRIDSFLEKLDSHSKSVSFQTFYTLEREPVIQV